MELKSSTFILTILLFSNTFNLKATNAAENKRNDILADIHNTVLEIYEHIKKQDKFQDIKDLLKIDSALKKIEQQNEDISRHLGNNLGRSGLSSSNVEQLENKLENIEEQLLTNVQGSIKKIGDVERQAHEIKSDMDKKLGKMMNVMSSVYEMSQKVTDRIESGKIAKQNEDDDKNTNNFLTDQIESLERKIDEKFNQIERQFLKQYKEIEISLSSMYSTCELIMQDVETVKGQCSANPVLPSIIEPLTLPDDYSMQRITENIFQNLTRTQREINEKMEKKLLDLEAKINHQQPVRQHHSKVSKQFEHQMVNVKENIEKEGNQPATQSPKPVCTSVTLITKPKCCKDLFKAGATCDGPYIIFPQGKRAIYAYCDMTHDGGGWTVLMRRGSFAAKSISFDRNWKDYKEGFGENTAEFWLGNENIHLLTNQEEMILQVELKSFDGENITFNYDPFAVASESQHYRLHIGRVIGNLSYQGSSLRHHNMRPFSTFDKNNEGTATSENCPGKFKGGWWYNRCHYALLTAPYFKETEQRQKWQGIQWHAWKGQNILSSAEMRIRPKNFN